MVRAREDGAGVGPTVTRPPVAVLFIHDLWAVAPHGSYIHRGSCPRAWAVSQQQIFELQQAYEGAAIFAITWHVSEFEKFAVAELPAQIFFPTPSLRAKPANVHRGHHVAMLDNSHTPPKRSK